MLKQRRIGDIIHDIKVEPNQYEKLVPPENDNHRPYFRKTQDDLKLSTCGDITITNCIFNRCYAKSYSGGSIHIEHDSSVLIHSTIFNNSYTGRRLGGACVICKTITDEDINFKTDPLKRLDIQYCCFQDCSGSDEEKLKLYGVAVFSAANQTVLYYASTVNCPGEKNEAKGSQFDLNVPNVTSHSVNSTGGKSTFCGGIEYRNTEKGFFRFQSISNSGCKFAIAYTDVSGTTNEYLDLSFSNIFYITLHSNTENNAYPGLIHVRKTGKEEGVSEFMVKNFCFINDNFGDSDDAKIISRGAIGVNTFQRIKVILNDCSYDCDDNRVAITSGNLDSSMASIDNCNQGSAVPTTNTVSQLSLGDCMGGVPPEPFTPLPATSNFSESFYFSESEKFEQTNYFSNSNVFTKSNLPSLNNDAVGGGKKQTGMIVGVTVADVAAVAIIAALVAFFIWKKKHINIDENSADVVGGQESVISVDNNLNTVMQEDDPFAGDFNAGD